MGGTKVEAPEARDMGAEGERTLAAQVRLAPQQFENYAKFTPQYDAIDMQRLGKALYGNDYQGQNLTQINDDLTAKAGQQSREANTLQREADIADVARLGGGVQDTIRGSNKELFGALGRMEDAVAPDSVASQMKQRAMEQFQLGGDLSAEELRDVQQSSRAAFAGRGLALGNESIGDEVMNTYQARQARSDKRLQDLATAEQYYNGLNTQLLGAAQSTMFDPFQGVLGRQSVNQGTNSALMGGAQGVVGGNSAAGREQFNPFNNYASQMYGQNSAQQMQANQATAANKTAVTGALIGAAGSAAGAM